MLCMTPTLYSKNDMYTPNGAFWTLSNLDWKQVGLMFKRILGSPRCDNQFIKTLINEGVCIRYLEKASVDEHCYSLVPSFSTLHTKNG